MSTKKLANDRQETNPSLEPEWSMGRLRTPVGEIWVACRDDHLWGAELEPRWPQLAQRLLVRGGVSVTPGQLRAAGSAGVTRALAALKRYFAGELDAPTEIPLALDGSSLQERVWAQLRKIAPGRIVTYKQLATRARQKGAFRAIGAANGANPCAIFVPCHRVVSTSGTLQGYGAGIEAKSWLLIHEGVENDGWRLTARTGE